jgi:hypothetical protein
VTEKLITEKQKSKLKKLLGAHGVVKDLDGLTKGQAQLMINRHQKWHKLTDEEKAKLA